MSYIIESMQSTLATYQGDVPKELHRAMKCLQSRQFHTAYDEIRKINKMPLPLPLQVITQLFTGVCCYFYVNQIVRTYWMRQPTGLGLAYKRECRYIEYSYPLRKAAKEAFEAAVKLAPTCFMANLGLGKTLIKLNEKQKGFRYIVKAVQLSNFDPEVFKKCQKIFQKELQINFIDCWEKKNDAPSFKSIEALAESRWAYDRLRATISIRQLLTNQKLAGTAERAALNTLLSRLAGISICGIGILGTGDSDYRVRQAALALQTEIAD
jgi:hypothetical protein